MTLINYTSYGRSRNSDPDWEAAETLKAFREEAIDKIAKVMHRLTQHYGFPVQDHDAIGFLELVEEAMCDQLVPDEDWVSAQDLGLQDTTDLCRKAWGKALEEGE